MNVIRWPQTPGIPEAAAGSVSQRSGLWRVLLLIHFHLKRNSDAGKEIPEFKRVFAPDRLVPVHCKDWNEDQVVLADPVTPDGSVICSLN